MEGLGRTLGKWRSYGCSGFGIHGEELANRAGERKPLKLCLWRREEEEDEQEMREPELELRRWRRTFWTSEATSKGDESCSTAGTRQRPAGSSVTAWATARRRFPIGYGLFPVRSLVVDGWRVAQLAEKTGGSSTTATHRNEALREASVLGTGTGRREGRD